MQISSTAQRPLALRPQATVREAYHEAKEQYIDIATVQAAKADSGGKWVTGASIVSGIAAAVAIGTLGVKYNFGDQLAGYSAGLGGIGTLLGVGFVLGKIGDHKLAQSGFVEVQQNYISKRDEYRDSLLSQLNDQGVNETVDERWSQMKAKEKPDFHLPTRLGASMTEAVGQLEFLADNRQRSGWVGKLAHTQDDPAKFQTEVELVLTNDGLLQTLSSYQDANAV